MCSRQVQFVMVNNDLTFNKLIALLVFASRFLPQLAVEISVKGDLVYCNYFKSAHSPLSNFSIRRLMILFLVSLASKIAGTGTTSEVGIDILSKNFKLSANATTIDP